MPCLVVGRALPIRRVEQDVARGAEGDLLQRLGEILGTDGIRVLARREERRLVDQVAQLGADQARRLGGDALEGDVGRQGHVLGVHLENRGAAGAVGTLDHDAAVEAARSQQRLVEHVGAVGGGQDDDAFAGVEAVHLGQDLVQRLLALVVSAELRAAPARAADGVQFVDEDDRRRRLPRLLEQVAHARRRRRRRSSR